MSDIILLPGYGNSGAGHWQSRWEAGDSSIRRFAPAHWEEPDLADWIAALERAVAEAAPAPPLLVAHSLSCLLIAHWHQVSKRPIAGAFLVAVPDPDAPAFPAAARGFGGVPETRFGFASLIVASSNDPYASLGYAQRCAAQWGSALAVIGSAGHINGDSGIGDWPEGLALLKDFARRI